MLLISDLHFTDKTSDVYRFEVFKFVEKYFKKTGDKNLIILGDITDYKDHHSAYLVNIIVSEVCNLIKQGMEIFILKGNHDYINPDFPYFEFLKEIEYVRFIKNPCANLIEGQKCLFLPHTRNPIEEWKENETVKKYKKECDLVFIHQSVIGSVTSNGYLMEDGLSASYFNSFSGQVFAGDIHVPQELGTDGLIGGVHYVGSPYSIRFNDHFEGQAIALSNNVISNSAHSLKKTSLLKNVLKTKIPGRRTIEIKNVDDLEQADANPGDQIKVKVLISTSVDLEQIKKDVEEKAKELEFDLQYIAFIHAPKFPLRKSKKKISNTENPGNVVVDFSKRRGIDKNKIKIAKDIVDDV